jgi:diamine N-acetyltransferase
MTAVSYRDATTNDAKDIAELFARAFTDTFAHLYSPADLGEFLAGMSAEAFRQEIADPRFVFRLATVNGEVAGYVKLGPPELPVETPPETVQLYQLYVLNQWHGRGIAAGLMDWALQWARDQGAHHIQLSVYIDNHRARRFYERYGFVAVGRYDFMVGSHADEDIVLRHVVLQADQ